MRICALNGSLRGSRGVTNRLLSSMGKGATAAGGTWDVVNLASLRIEGCRACNHCQTTQSYRCVFEERDSVSQIFEQMAQADILLFASPVYVFGISSLLKRLFERFYSHAPIRAVHITRGGLFFHATDSRLTAKPFVSLVVCDNMEDLTVRNTKEFFEIYSRFMDAPHVGHLERRTAAAWLAALDSPAASNHAKAAGVLQAFERAGEELVRSGRLSQATIKQSNRSFNPVPLLVRVARHIPALRPRILAEMKRRAVMMSVEPPSPQEAIAQTPQDPTAHVQ